MTNGLEIIFFQITERVHFTVLYTCYHLFCGNIIRLQNDEIGQMNLKLLLSAGAIEVEAVLRKGPTLGGQTFSSVARYMYRC